MIDKSDGTVIVTYVTCGDADDVFFDSKRQRVYVSCGSGEIAVMQRQDRAYTPLTSPRTSVGARTSLFVPELDRLFVAERAAPLRSNAEIAVYRRDPS
jgi:hypothetical protein